MNIRRYLFGTIALVDREKTDKSIDSILNDI